MNPIAAEALWIALLLVATGCGPAPEPLDEDALVGTWAAVVRHNGQESRFVMRFGRDGEGPLTAIVSLPAIGAWDIGVGEATIQGENEVHVGSWVLSWDPRTPALEAVLPASLVPVHEISAVLTRLEPIEATTHPAIDAPRAEPLWTFDAGAPIWAGVAHAGGVVYTGTDAGELLALDARDGTSRWRLATGGAIRARPTVDDGRLFVPSDDGNLYRIDARTGDVEWKVRVVVDPYERGKRWDNYAAAATLSGDTLFLGTGDGRLHALDPGSGSSRWTYRAPDALTSTVAVAGGRIYFGCFDGKVYSLDAGTGDLVWEHATGAAIPSAPAVADSRVVIGSRSYDLLALDADTGTPLWTHYTWFSWVDSDPTVVGDSVYIGSSDAMRLFAIDLGTGRPRWTFHTGGWSWSQPAVTDHAVYTGAVGTTGYIGERRGGFFAVDRDRGTPLWQFVAEEPSDGATWGFASFPDVDDSRVFVGGLDGRLYAFAQDAG